jgi:hypothetical protein
MEIKQHILRTKYSDVFIDDEGFLCLYPDKDADMDLDEVKVCYGTYQKIGINRDNKVLQIINVKGNVSMSREARDYAAIHGSEFFIASAVISDSLSVRLIVNFFNLFYKSRTVPLKMFDTEENAKKWLRKFIG